MKLITGLLIISLMAGCNQLPNPTITISYEPKATPGPLPMAISEDEGGSDVDICAKDHYCTDTEVESGPTIIKTYNVNGYVCQLYWRPSINELRIYRDDELVMTYDEDNDQIIDFDIDQEGLAEAQAHCTPI